MARPSRGEISVRTGRVQNKFGVSTSSFEIVFVCFCKGEGGLGSFGRGSHDELAMTTLTMILEADFVMVICKPQ